MFEEKNVKIVENCYKIQNSKFYFQKSKNAVTINEFLEMANYEFWKRFGIEANFSAKARHTRSKTPLDGYTLMAINRYKSMCQRCKDAKYSEEPSVKRSPQMISYKKKNITLEMTREEFVNWMWENKHIHDAIVESGERSSVDRIDETKGYSLDNIQLLALHTNIEKRLGKKCRKYTKEELEVSSFYNAVNYKKSQKGA